MKKVLVNVSFGGFALDDEYYADAMAREGGPDNIREDEVLIALVEQGKDIGDVCSSISIAEIPDNATDFVIESDSDGREYVLYVVDGKIKQAENKCYL